MLTGRTNNGFTLIELLVVIAIIAVLAAILFPVFAQARGKAYQTTCLNNQRQLAASTMIYVQDHEETFFPVPSASWTTNIGGADAGLFDCPTNPSKGSEGSPDYGFNSNLCGAAIGSISDPSGTLLTADRNIGSASPGALLANFDADLGVWHSGKVMLSCVDGHSAVVKIQSDFPSRDLIFAGYTLLPLSSSNLAKQYSETLTINNGAGPLYKWASSNALVLPGSCYRLTADAPMPNMAVEFEISMDQMTNPGYFNCSALGMFVDNAELGLTPQTSTLDDVNTGFYAGTYRFGGATGENYAGLYSNGSHRFCMGSNGNAMGTSLPANFNNIPVMIVSNKGYRIQVFFQNYMATMIAYQGSTVLGIFSMPVNLPVDMAPGRNQMALYSKWQGANKVTSIRNISVYKLPQ